VHELEQLSIAIASILVDLAPVIAKERLQQEQKLTERANMYVSNTMKLPEFLPTNNYFKYDGHH